MSRIRHSKAKFMQIGKEGQGDNTKGDAADKQGEESQRSVTEEQLLDLIWKGSERMVMI